MTADRNFIVIGLGELLWDMFPEGKQLGGAPANFAYMTRLLGDEGIVASRVGSDALGRSAGRRLERLGVRAAHVQLDPTHPTGTVKVSVDPAGQPTFDIAESVAWDFFEWTPQWRSLAERADAVCFGSLAQRCPQSRATIRQFLSALRPGTTRVFDVNLRQSFYNAETLSESAKLADIMKVNTDELSIVAKLLKIPFVYDEVRAAHWLRDILGLKLVCITRGAKGSLLVSADEVSEHLGYRIHVADTVGAGDAFTAALVYHYLRHASVSTLNEAANRMGAWVSSEIGATPARDEFHLEKVRAAVGAEEF
ncbi:MAG: sugar kinase, ribokinase family [Candidatus Acidoferrum typicum]|nr:sugar kinase, ribokinase family [Candidatus Acidoferrum typicum]